MPTYPSPVTLSQFQTYLKDSSTDPTITGFYQTLLDSATEFVYTWLDQDFTANASKTDVFWGDDSFFYIPRHPVGTLTLWTSTDRDGVQTDNGVGDLLLRSNGTIVQSKTLRFAACAEQSLTYQLPSGLTCPETVKQVITEIAALELAQSNHGDGSLGLLLSSEREGTSTGRVRYLDLTDRHKEMLRPYKRFPV